MEPAWSPSDYRWDGFNLTATGFQAALNPQAAGTSMQMAAALGQMHHLAMPLAKCKSTAPRKPQHKPACQVAGCTADLSGSRAYYRRYRICEKHFRMPSMMLENKVVRFCQQCAKFEPIAQFQGDKRSCRRQLDRHNERRKRKGAKAAKPQGAESEDDNSDDSSSPNNGQREGRVIDTVLAELFQSSSLQRGPATTPGAPPSAMTPAADDAEQVFCTTTDAGRMKMPEDCLAASPAPCQLDELPELSSAHEPSAQEHHVIAQQHQHDSQARPLATRSVSDMTVEAQRHRQLGAGAGQPDAALTAAARHLLAQWQHEEGANMLDQTLGCMEAGASSGHAAQLVPPGGRPESMMLGGVVGRRDAAEPGSADSSVHGPASMSGPDSQADKLARVMDALTQSQCLDAIRADQQPLVREMGTQQAAPPATTAACLPHQPQQATPHSAGMANPYSQQLGGNCYSNPLDSAAFQQLPTCSLTRVGSSNHNSHMSNQGMPGMYPGSFMPNPSMMSNQQEQQHCMPGGMMHVPGSEQPANPHSGMMAPGMMPQPQTQPPGPSQWPGNFVPGGAGPSQFNPASLMCQDGSCASTGSMQDMVPPHWQMPSANNQNVFKQEASQQSYTATPQVPLHPVLASLNTTAPQPIPQQHQQQADRWAQAISRPAHTVGNTWPPAHSPPSQGLMGMINNPPAAQQQPSLARHLGQAGYLLTELCLTRLSIKLHGVTPEALPQDLRTALTDWLSSTDVRLLQGFIRPGCVHLSLDCLVTAGAKQAMASSAATSMSLTGPMRPAMHNLDDLLHHTLGVNPHVGAMLPPSLAGLFSSCTIVELQSPNKLVLMEGEAVWSVTTLDKRPNLPTITHVQPLAILAGSRNTQQLYVTGQHLESNSKGASFSGAAGQSSNTQGCSLLVRSQGQFVNKGSSAALGTADSSCTEGDSSKTNAAPTCWRVDVDTSELQPGLAVVECQAGRLLSNWRPVLVVDDVGVLHEVSQLQALQNTFPERVTAIITDLALLVQLQASAQQTTAPAPAAAAPQPWQQSPAYGKAHADHQQGHDQDDEQEQDNDDAESLTAPSVSDVDDTDSDRDSDEEYDGDQAHDEAMNDASDAVMGSPGYRHAYLHATSAAAGLPMAVRQLARHAHSVRMQSWESEASTDMDTSLMHSSWGSTNTNSFLQESGQVVEMDVPGPHAHRHGLKPAEPLATHEVFTAEMRSHLAAKAIRLLAFACDAGWPCTARMLMDLLTTVPMQAPQYLHGVPVSMLPLHVLAPMSVQSVLSSCPTADGLTPLHRAARSGSVSVVKEVLAVARSAGLVLNTAAREHAPASPLHFAAACRDNGATALTLLRASVDAPVQWFVAQAQDGSTPAQCAEAVGSGHVNQVARSMVQDLARQS